VNITNDEWFGARAAPPVDQGDPSMQRDLTRTTLAVLFIGMLIAASLLILRPFLAATIWATMIVVATWPVLLALEKNPSIAVQRLAPPIGRTQESVERAAFENMLAEAALSTKRRLQILEVRGASADHPTSVTCEETDYLKCYIGRVF